MSAVSTRKSWFSRIDPYIRVSNNHLASLRHKVVYSFRSQKVLQFPSPPPNPYPSQNKWGATIWGKVLLTVLLGRWRLPTPGKKVAHTPMEITLK